MQTDDHLAGFSGEFEAHVTVAPLGPGGEASFRDACAALGVEPVLIELPVGAGPVQPMTASRHAGAFADVRREAEAVAARLAGRGFAVRRLNIVASRFAAGVPAPAGEAAALPPNTYFEFHLKLLLDADAPDETALAALCDAHGAHLSRDTFKRRDDGKQERFVTLRCHGAGHATAQRDADCLAEALATAGYTVAKRVTEFCVFDSDAGVDDDWTGGEP
jgi:hypothetical protein